MKLRLFKLTCFVQESHLEITKSAFFAVGIGRIGNYDSCCWQTLGEGQFRPLAGSAPYLGRTGEIRKLPDYEVETVCCGALLVQSSIR